MVTIDKNSTLFDFKLTDIASLFGIVLNDTTDELQKNILVLAPVAMLLRDMVMRGRDIPGSLYDVVFTLLENMESIVYPDHFDNVAK